VSRCSSLQVAAASLRLGLEYSCGVTPLLIFTLWLTRSSLLRLYSGTGTTFKFSCAVQSSVRKAHKYILTLADLFFGVE
jgi:hypothetical protein